MPISLSDPEFWDQYPELRDLFMQVYAKIDARGRHLVDFLAQLDYDSLPEGDLDLDQIAALVRNALSTHSAKDMDKLREVAPKLADKYDVSFHACLELAKTGELQPLPYENGFAVLELVVTKLVFFIRAYCRYKKEERDEEGGDQFTKFRYNPELLAYLPKEKTFFAHIEGRLPQAILWNMSSAEMRVEDVLAAIQAGRKCDFYLADTDAVSKLLHDVS